MGLGHPRKDARKNVINDRDISECSKEAIEVEMDGMIIDSLGPLFQTPIATHTQKIISMQQL